MGYRSRSLYSPCGGFVSLRCALSIFSQWDVCSCAADTYDGERLSFAYMAELFCRPASFADPQIGDDIIPKKPYA